MAYMGSPLWHILSIWSLSTWIIRTRSTCQLKSPIRTGSYRLCPPTPCTICGSCSPPQRTGSNMHVPTLSPVGRLLTNRASWRDPLVLAPWAQTFQGLNPCPTNLTRQSAEPPPWASTGTLTYVPVRGTLMPTCTSPSWSTSVGAGSCQILRYSTKPSATSPSASRYMCHMSIQQARATGRPWTTGRNCSCPSCTTQWPGGQGSGRGWAGGKGTSLEICRSLRSLPTHRATSWWILKHKQTSEVTCFLSIREMLP